MVRRAGGQRGGGHARPCKTPTLAQVGMSACAVCVPAQGPNPWPQLPRMRPLWSAGSAAGASV